MKLFVVIKKNAEGFSPLDKSFTIPLFIQRLLDKEPELTIVVEVMVNGTINTDCTYVPINSEIKTVFGGNIKPEFIERVIVQL